MRHPARETNVETTLQIALLVLGLCGHFLKKIGDGSGAQLRTYWTESWPRTAISVVMAFVGWILFGGTIADMMVPIVGPAKAGLAGAFAIGYFADHITPLVNNLGRAVARRGAPAVAAFAVVPMVLVLAGCPFGAFRQDVADHADNVASCIKESQSIILNHLVLGERGAALTLLTDCVQAEGVGAQAELNAYLEHALANLRSLAGITSLSQGSALQVRRDQIRQAIGVGPS